MRIFRSGTMILAIGCLVFASACATADRTMSTAPAATSAPEVVPGPVAAGSFGDTLQACMNRIPKGASAGQRMMAELSCERDQANRQAIEAVPGGK